MFYIPLAQSIDYRMCGPICPSYTTYIVYLGYHLYVVDEDLRFQSTHTHRRDVYNKDYGAIKMLCLMMVSEDEVSVGVIGERKLAQRLHG